MTKLTLAPIELPKLSGTKDTVSIEELSPEAIIPDSIPIYRDPEVEIPEESDSADTELGRKFTEIDLDRMTDDQLPEETEKRSQSERVTRRGQRKRKYGAVDEAARDEPERKRTASPAGSPSVRRTARG